MAGTPTNYMPLFETTKSKFRFFYRLFASSIFAGVVSIWVYRATHIPELESTGRKLAWIGLFASEIWFGLYWVLTQSLRWNLTFRETFKDRLSQRYEKELPKVDVFVCTADPTMEPPVMVINTVLSVMAYDYPTEKLAVYLSDDGGSELTFYALLEASEFAKYWMPFCKKYKIEPRSPAAYFSGGHESYSIDDDEDKDLVAIKKLYDEMEYRITTATRLGRISENIRSTHKGFSQWDSSSSSRNHDAILQILVDGRDPNAKDIEGFTLPTLVYLAREKRPQHFHNFKAGSLNALIRVSSEISGGQILLNVDCDMYSNNSNSVRDALCFFMDEEKGHEIAFVQYPQHYVNLTKNDLYSSSLRVIELEFHGLDAHGGPLYVGTGCFHRRNSLCGERFFEKSRTNTWKSENGRYTEETVHELEKRLKGLASCTFEDNTQWGKEMGLRYGCPVEDVITGLSIQCLGWKSVFFSPQRSGFLGVVPTSLDQALVQHKRWSEGDLLILLSRYSPAWYGRGKISLGLRMGYLTYCFWAPNCVATLYYSFVPSLYLVKGISLFPQVSSLWFLPFAYVIVAKYIYSLAEFLRSGGTLLGWWNDQRMWLYKRTSSYLFAFTDTIFGLFGFSETSFVLTSKVADPDVTSRYEQEIMEFRSPLAMFIILATIGMVNLLSLGWVVKKMVVDGGDRVVHEGVILQVVLCGVLVLINLPLYQALFLRKDMGKIPSSVAVKSVLFALFVCSCSVFLY